MIKTLIISVIFAMGVACEPKKPWAAEKDYQVSHCIGAVEFVLPDRTRVDCLTDKHAIEYDFGKKWAEAIGQSLHYAMHTGKRAGIVLILAPDEMRFYDRAQAVVEHYGMPIDIQVISK